MSDNNKIGASPAAQDRATHEPNPQAVSALRVGIADAVSREAVLALCSEAAELHADYALHGDERKSKQREAAEAMATALRHRVEALPAIFDDGACNFCGATHAQRPRRVLVHENGSAICADCVAAAVLSLANYAASGGEARQGGDSEASSVHEHPAPEGGDAQ